MSNPLSDEIDYLKTLAEDGSKAPVLSGPLLFWAGLLFGAMAFVHYGLLRADIGFPSPWFISATWIATGLVYGLISYFSNRRLSGVLQSNAQNMNRTLIYVWSAIGFSVMIMFLTLSMAGAQINQLEVLLQLVPALMLTVYGTGWLITSAVSRRVWMLWPALAAYAASIAQAYFINSVEQILVFGVSMVLIALIPGWILMSRARG